MNLSRASIIVGTAISQFVAPQIRAAQDCTTIAGLKVCALGAPSLETKEAIGSLKSDSGPLKADELNIKSLSTELPTTGTKDQTTTGTQDQATTGTKDQTITGTKDQTTAVPFVAQNSMILQFQPDLKQADVDDYIKSNNLQVVKTFPSIGAVQVKTDLSRFFQPKSTDAGTRDTLLRGLSDASKEFKKDPRIFEASPDVFLSGKSDDISKLEMTTKPVYSLDTKMTDWGIHDIQADQLWDKPGAGDGAIFGVLDGGFGRHEDLVFLGFKGDTPAADHGTHVSGIACGSHAKPHGTRGVLPNCMIRAAYADILFRSQEGGAISQTLILYSQVLGKLTEFVDENDDVSAFNVSLGLNWGPNLNSDPEAPENADWRANIQSQGNLFYTALKNAAKKGKFIFTAAGNDSASFDQPVNARYASPLNWAALFARDFKIRNAVIVEAHDQNGKSAAFSNRGGDISCPGVDIVSTVAFDQAHQPSRSSYGEMSGTSEASPYCAAGFVLFRLVRPNYSGEAALDCLLKSTAKSTSNVPMMRLADAYKDCP